jgi:hypothetical protein
MQGQNCRLTSKGATGKNISEKMKGGRDGKEGQGGEEA